jgi:protein SCO1
MTDNRFRIAPVWLIGAIAGIHSLGLSAFASAQSAEPLPEELKGVGVTEHLSQQIPWDLEFIDSEGRKATLKQYFDGHRPVIMTMNYSNCPMLCSLQLNGLFDALQKMPWSIGKEYEMVTVSFDPEETSDRAQATKQKYLKTYRREGAAEGWHFLTGREENIKKLAEAIGFRYRYSESTKQYLHVAVTYILTPDGHLSRYLYGVKYDPQTIRLAMVEAADGKIGSTTDQILLFCFHYDAENGRYAPAAYRLMQIGGAIFLLVGGGVFWKLRRREKTKKIPSTVE